VGDVGPQGDAATASYLVPVTAYGLASGTVTATIDGGTARIDALQTAPVESTLVAGQSTLRVENTGSGGFRLG
jgi:hypothetical protein